MIVVFGSTGNIGSAVVRELKARGAAFKAAARDPEAAKSKLGDDVEVVRADLSNRASVDAAVAGADSVFLVCGHSPALGDLEANAIEAAKAAGVKLFMKSSGSTKGITPDSGSVVFRAHHASQESIRASGMDYVILQPNLFMQTMLMQAQNVAKDSKVILPWPADTKLTMIDTRDIGAVAAEILVNDGHTNEDIYLSGAPTTPIEFAGELTKQLGREIAFVSPPWEAAAKVMAERGMPGWLIDHQKQIKELCENGAFGIETDNVKKITGKEPRTLAGFIHDYIGAFQA